MSFSFASARNYFFIGINCKCVLKKCNLSLIISSSVGHFSCSKILLLYWKVSVGLGKKLDL